MFLRSVQLEKFLYHSQGAFKQLCQKKFLGIDELWILQEIKRLPPLFKWCSSGRCSLEIFYIIPVVHSSNCTKKNFGHRRTLNFAKIKRFHPHFRGCSSGRCSLQIFYIIISASSTCQRVRMTRRGDESDVVSCISFSTRHATTERIFLIIDNFRIFDLNNLKFSVKLLYTHMNNSPTGSFLSV